MEHWLEEQFQLAVRDGLSEIKFQMPAVVQPVIHLGCEEAMLVPAFSFRAVQGQVGIPDELVRVSQVRTGDCDADAYADCDLPPQ